MAEPKTEIAVRIAEPLAVTFGMQVPGSCLLNFNDIHGMTIFFGLLNLHCILFFSLLLYPYAYLLKGLADLFKSNICLSYSR